MAFLEKLEGLGKFRMVFLLTTKVVPDEAVYSPEPCSPQQHCSFMSPALPLEDFVTPGLKVPGGLEA